MLNRLIINGLPLANSINNTSKKVSQPKLLLQVLPRTSQILYARFRASILKSLLLENNQTYHICAIDCLLKTILRDADLHHIIYSSIMLITLQEHVTKFSPERQIVIYLLIYGYLKRISDILDNKKLCSHSEKMYELMKAHKIHVFDLVDGLDESPAPLCIRTSEDPCIHSYYISLDTLESLFCSELSDDETSIVTALFANGFYTPDKDLEQYKDLQKIEQGRKSLFPASPKKPLGSESASTTILAHRRSMFSLPAIENASLTVPGYKDQITSSTGILRHHQVNSSSSLTSQLSRTSSLKKGPFRSLNVSNDTLPSTNEGSSGSDESVLEGDFADLAVKYQEKSRETKDRSC